MAVDSLGFLSAVGGLPEQLEAAHVAASASVQPGDLPGPSDVDNIVILGMGGSGISGDVLAAVSNATLPIPINVLRQYRTPAYIGPRTLAFAMSYSGGTEETLSMARGAVDAGARLVAVSNGGELARFATEAGGLHVGCPDGYMPRAALGALIAPLFVCLEKIGLLPDASAWLRDATKQLERRRDLCSPSVVGEANPARELARQIDRTIPLVYGGGALGAVAAMRWKCDVNENAKAPAFYASYPELDHNEICGWGQHGDVTRQVITLIELRHSFEHKRLQPRFDITRSLVDECVAKVVEARAQGDGRLAQLLDLMYFGDWVSCYMALANDVDPGPIPAIDHLKRELAV
ncbi:MAG: bifunctional phosphoglucose/phosphomannose isomerase [Acidimicrobiia bacterium]|nr:bifunctional phosphoglucose/phosphomannose isomerase [Acidimicrobiia bacterium]